MSKLWTWTAPNNITPHNDRNPDNREDACNIARILLGARAERANLACYETQLNIEPPAVVITVYLVWCVDELELLRKFLKTDPAKDLLKDIGDNPPIDNYYLDVIGIDNDPGFKM